MSEYGPSTFGDEWAELYDSMFGEADVTAMVDALARLAAGRPALELGIGTGRVALPLAERGVEVHGIDASEKMVAKLREKPGGERIPVTIGDFADVPAKGEFGLVFVVFNTFYGLLTQEAQVQCFRNVASHLLEDGVFLIEAFFPDVNRFDRGQRVDARAVHSDHVAIGVTRHSPTDQTLVEHHVVLSPSGTRLYPIQLRYIWPSEMNLMAELAGMRLRERWGDWNRAPFGDGSQRHISIFERSR